MLSRIAMTKLAQSVPAALHTVRAGIQSAPPKLQHALARKEPEADPYLYEQEISPLPQTLSFQPLHAGQVPAVLDLVLGTYLDVAPLNRAVGIKPEDARTRYEERVAHAIEKDQGCSFVVIDGDTNKIVGVILNEKLLRGRRRYTPHYPESVKKIDRFLQYVEGDPFAQLPHSNSIFKIHDTFVKQGYQNHGIGKTLMKLSADKAAQLGCDYLVGTATSPLAQKLLFEKIGLAPIRACSTMYYTDLKTQEKPFQSVAHSSPKVVFMAKKLGTYEAPF